jgi:hypothetical protein
MVFLNNVRPEIVIQKVQSSKNIILISCAVKSTQSLLHSRNDCFQYYRIALYMFLLCRK